MPDAHAADAAAADDDDARDRKLLNVKFGDFSRSSDLKYRDV